MGWGVIENVLRRSILTVSVLVSPEIGARNAGVVAANSP